MMRPTTASTSQIRGSRKNSKSAPSNGNPSQRNANSDRTWTGIRRQTQSSESFMSNGSTASSKSGRNRLGYQNSLRSSLSRNRERTRKQSSVDDLRCSSSDWSDTSLPHMVGWQAFQQEINNIDDCSAMFKSNNAVPVRARSSEAFNRVMGDMKAKQAEQRAAAEAAKQAGETSRPDDIIEVDEYESESEEEDPASVEAPAISPLRQAALRGWQIIRRNIQDVAMEHKKKNSSFSWAFLRQHISNMTDTEKARQDLYQKYIYKPSTWWSEGLVNFPAHIFEKKQGIRGRRPGSRAQSAFTPNPLGTNPSPWRPSSAAVHRNNYSMPTVGWR